MRIRSAAGVAAIIATGGQPCEVLGDPETPVGPDVVIDSREATPGALFVALPGERVDGHDYLDQAAAGGAAAALVDRRAEIPAESGLTRLLVADALQGLTALARGLHAEARAAGLVTVAVTGSAGKTSTKDLLAQVLAAARPTVSPIGSFNNELGTPLTACGLSADTGFLVSEMGARASGDISYLRAIVPPTIGVVLNVGTAHLGEFGSREAIARAKGELVAALPADGWAVLNADDPLVSAMSERTTAHIARFQVRAGTDTAPPDQPAATADLLVSAAELVADDLDRYGFELTARWADGRTASTHVQLRLVGSHQVANAAAAAAAALVAGLSLELVGTALSAATARSPWRMELHELSSGAALINDAYNANPESMAAAIQSLAGIAGRRRATHPQARAYAVLGDMLELGPDSPARHRAIGELAGRAGVDEVLAIGEFATDVVAGAESAGARARVVAVESAAGSLELRRGDVVLVKASRGLQLERVAEALLGQEGQQ